MKYYFLLTVSYDGYNYNGWAKQPNLKSTIQGQLEYALSMFCQTKMFTTAAASRTDTHVHAIDQKVKIELDFLPNIKKMYAGLNKILPLDIQVKNIELISKDFDVRGSILKKYQFQIMTTRPGVFDAKYYQYCDEQFFDFKKFKKAILVFKGEHNFRNFIALKRDEIVGKDTNRVIDSIRVKKFGNKIFIEFTAKGFLKHQIRIMLGAAIAHSNGKIELQDIFDVLNLRKDKMDYIAEGKGLFLKKIIY
ncbi:tRNA pseudouridine synthase A [Spiroplasma sp. TIUS-1]|uniref:tRNA pseudouridine(38-40) synthase TruA n=1 Tax=Spiroplasma sp. TIUS-1 TaxID=216963 RepID=UPI0013972ABC|nr:tRNA pseudouridine(38-40) synthase TruA [Spiroplasma sp. TIUS-1]QHX36151.1 tRNA pseudouridine synthase A [Spiroplasma sp. TIUS-1]